MPTSLSAYLASNNRGLQGLQSFQGIQGIQSFQGTQAVQGLGGGDLGQGTQGIYSANRRGLSMLAWLTPG